MDPITLVVTAVALGASAGLKDSATQAVKDAYASLKGLLAGRRVDVSGVEGAPDAQIQRAALADTLGRLPGGVEELLSAAQAVTDAVAAHAPDAAQVVGVNVSEVQAEFLRIQKVVSTGDGIEVVRSSFRGGIDIGSVDAGVEPRHSTDPGGRRPSTR